MHPVRLIAVLVLSASTAVAQHTVSTLSVPAGYSSSASVRYSAPEPAFAGGNAFAASGGASTAPAASAHTTPFSGLAIGAKVGVLGIGVEAATPLARRFNLRGGANFFSYTDNLTSDGIHYDAKLRFRSGEASLDWFPFVRSFHISPGLLFYNGNQITGSAAVPGGQTFTLNDVTYRSSPSDPVNGTGRLKFNQAAPKVTVGFGNMLPRNGGHFSVPFELGFAYEGYPKVALNLAGTVCDPTGVNCEAIASDPSVQANIAAQQTKISNDAAPARFYPLLSLGFAYSF
jgi:hypothetical protein